MSDEENVNIRFVVPKGVKSEIFSSDDMKMAFQVWLPSIFLLYFAFVETHPMRQAPNYHNLC
jgi:hypothetical protein